MKTFKNQGVKITDCEFNPQSIADTTFDVVKRQSSSKTIFKKYQRLKPNKFRFNGVGLIRVDEE